MSVPAPETRDPEEPIAAAVDPVLKYAASQPSDPPQRRPPNQRLDSLRKREVAASSTSSTTPGLQGTQSSALKFQPKFFIRRSREEREAQEKAAEEKRQARLAANTTNNPSGGGSYTRGSWRGGLTRGGFRGGMSGWRAERRGMGVATGPLSGGPTNEVSTSKRGRGARTVGGKGASGSSHTGVTGRISPTASHVKSEPDIKPEGSRSVVTGGARKSTRKGNQTKIKVEDNVREYISSDAELDETEGPRINIEHINLISDDDSSDDPIPSKGKERQRSLKQSGWSLKPIRLDRHEHVERHVGLTTDASSLTSTQLRHKAKERAHNEGAVLISDGEEGETTKAKPKKPKSKGKDVEFVRDERKWKGVYQDEEDIQDTKIKKEHIDEDIMVVDAPNAIRRDEEKSIIEVVGLPSSTTSTGPDPTRPDKDDASVSPKIKHRQRSTFRSMKPVLQTEEDRQEWERYEDDVIALGEELGMEDTPVAASRDRVGRGDRNGDIEMVDDAQDKKDDRRQGLVYLFQLPPILPFLIDSDNSKNDKLDDFAEPLSDSSNMPAPAELTSKVAPSSVKKLPGTSTKTEDDPPSYGLNTTISKSLMAEDHHFFHGSVGRLSVYESGYIGLTWGGIEHELSKGAEGELLQELVISNVQRIKREDGREDDGEVERTGMAMGQVTGGFVVTPNWGSLFEA
ncbi:hypothetical protein MMC19_005933 [Ptychographa xylographoides]|nr:hypothetical protein [Ptychographa xylographoides]